VVATRSGRVEGRFVRGRAVFRGVPYAAPPVGERRFRAPVPPEPWTGVRDARGHAPAAPQNEAMIRILSALAGTGPAGVGDDCLTVNVWTPAADDAKRPVLVWIHGGAFLMGSGGALVYDGGSLAARGDLVVVTVNYRLGAFGFLSFGESAPAGFADSNPGLRDQVAALEWVRDNIAAFGGDPERVTIFGESAGAMSVGTLLATPAARGLFRGAIAQSGAMHNVSTPEASARVAETFLAEFGLAMGDAHALRDVPTRDLLRAQRKVTQKLGFTHRGLPFQPAEDGDWLPEQPLAALEAGRAAQVPLLLGTNRDEWDLFQAGDRKARELDAAALRRRFERAFEASADAAAADELYAAVYGDRPPHRRWSAFQTDRVFRAPAERMAELHSEHAPTWAYGFTWVPPHLRRFVGAGHAMEVPLVFGTWRHPMVRGLTLGAGPLSRKIQDRWIAFARDGDPGHPKWKPYTREGRHLHRLGPRGDCPMARFEQVRAFWAAHDHGTRG